MKTANLFMCALFMFLSLTLKAQDSIKPTVPVKDSLPKMQQYIYDKLNPDQVFELESRRLEMGRVTNQVPDHSNIISNIGFLATVILLVFITSYFRHKRKMKLYDVYLRTLDKDKDLPVEFLKKPENPEMFNQIHEMSKLNKAIMLVALGFGCNLAFSYFQDSLAILRELGTIPLFLGIGFFVSHVIEYFVNRSKR